MASLKLALPALLVALAAPPGAAAVRAQQADSAQALLEQARREGGVSVSDSEHLQRGDVTVAASDTVRGDVITYRGTVEVLGVVLGDVVALGGSVRVRPGGRVGGSAVAVSGTVENDGGTVSGETVELGLASLRDSGGALRRRNPVALAAGWACVLAVVGVAILLLARRNLERVAETVRERFTRSLLWGILGQLAFFPALLVIMVALAITIIGILIIPIAVVAYVTAAIGAAALGFLAVAYASGESIDRAARRRGGAIPLLSMLVGILIYFGAWLLAGSLEWAGLIGSALRALVGLVTWVALSAGFGATLLTRGGSREPALESADRLPPPDDAWQTPTPVAGVAAARRPTPAPRSYNR